MDNIHDLPVLSADDYEAFRDIPTRDLPYTYDEWLKLTANDKLERQLAGFNVIQTPINSRDFKFYLSRTGHSANLKTLADFTLEKRLGNH